MSTVVKWIWIVILAFLSFDYYAVFVFLAEIAIFAVLYHFKPEHFR